MKNLLVALLFLIPSFALADVKEIYITCAQDDWDYIYENWEEEIYIPCQIKYKEQEWTDCEIRFRGQGSKSNPRKSLKIKFNENDFANGKSKINLNADITDPTRIRQYLASRLLIESQQICFYTEHYRVYLNGKYKGLYLYIENTDDDFLEERYLSTDNNLYKAAMDFACLSPKDDLLNVWEKKTNENGSWDDLILLIKEISDTPNADFYDYLQKKFVYSELINLFAMNMLLANASTYTHNFYMYNNKELGKWQMFPWDLDKTFNAYSINSEYRRCGNEWYQDNPLFLRSLIDDKIFGDIKNRLTELNDDLFSEEHILPIIDSLKGVLAESALEDTLFNFTSKEEWLKKVDGEKYFFKNRYNNLLKQFKEFPRPFYVSGVDSMETGTIKITWDKAKNLSNEGSISYDVYFGNKPYFPLDKSTILHNYTDTSYTLDNLEPGKYYYRIEAYNTKNDSGRYKMWGSDKLNKFVYKKSGELDCTINDDVILTEANSPYTLDCPLEITSTGSLTMEAGSEIIFSSQYGHKINGKFIIKGTKEKPAKISFADKNSDFIFEAKNTEINIDNAEIENLRIFSYDCKVSITNSKINIPAKFNDDNRVCYDLKGPNSSTFINNVIAIGNNSFDFFIIRDSKEVFIEYSSIDNCRDALEFIHITNGIMRNNHISNATDDAIDLNYCIDAHIYNNIITNTKDKAISVDCRKMDDFGKSYIYNNLIVGASIGVASKSTAYSIIYNNTFYNIDSGIVVNEKYPGDGRAKADISNCIFRNCKGKILTVLDNSEANITYSLTDDKKLDGIGNITGDPQFVNANKMDFHLQSNSPCINSGDPNSRKDPDGTRADMGAYYHHQSSSTNYSIVINEINYHSADNHNTGDWVEFYNPSNKDINISKWYFSDEKNDHRFIFPNGTIIEKDSYLVLFEKGDLFKLYHSNVQNSLGNMEFGLSGKGELIRLFNKENELIDSVLYDDAEPWNTSADGNGNTLELINPKKDNALAKYWQASFPLYGTPGQKNSTYNSVKNQTNNLNISAYPNPAKEKISVKINAPIIGQMKLKIIDINGITLKESNIFSNSGEYITTFNLSGYSQGVYYIISEKDNSKFIIPITIER